MTRNTFHSIALLLVLLFHSVVLMGQRTWSNADYIKIDINSGNPSFPYPQFLEYTKGKTLAKYNAEGVTHADMEKAGREAYEIMSHRCRYDGGTHCGVPYITFNNFPKFGAAMPQGGAEFCSEGDGYMLLAAAIFADQPTFNGLWMWVHDNRLSKVKKYSDGTWLRQGYVLPNGRLVCRDPEAGIGMPGWNCLATHGVGASATHSAADGDYDIAMALLIAYKQWGEFMYHNGRQVIGGDGNPISYKKAAQDFIKALVDTVPYYTANGMQNGYLTGDIGVDGYPKGGNSWGELTNWRPTQTMFGAELREVPSMGGGSGGASYVDYNSPAYFNEFAYWLEHGDGEGTPWQITQYKRAEASSDWVVGQLNTQGYIGSVGKYQINANNTVTFSAFNAGEDFRFAWRHILNYLWHGNPTTTWNPATHAVEPGGNTFEYDLAMRHAEFMKKPRNGATVTCAKLGASPDPGQPSWSGPAQIRQSYFMNGGIQDASGSNYALGCSAPAAVASEDLSFIADMYRQSEIVWDDASALSTGLSDDDRYINSMPKYFHGWFRNLGMLTNTGNLHAPRNMVPKANMKVYMSVDKTYAYQGDKITYTVQYRNYGSKAAEGVTIITELDPNYEFVSANKGGKLSGNKIVWNVGSVPGFKSGGLAATIDSVQFTVIAKDVLNPRICLTSTISGNNFDDWVSNEFPNNATYTMERNCVDILANRSLYINKTANRNSLNPNDMITFTVEFGNKSEGESSWLNGGRDNVRISYGNHYMQGNAYQFYQLYRFWNDSHEAYINMNNYRVSYFMYDAAAIGLYDAAKNPTGWTFVVDNQNDLDKYGYNPATGPITFSYQKIPQGEDANGKWNQRLMIRFADVLMAPSTHVYDKLDSKYLIHKGVWGPGFIRARLASNPAQDLTARVQDDWSFSTDVRENALDGQGATFTLISPCWANYDAPGYVINNYSRHVCNPTSAKNYGRILVEEFDGYTWRRIQGTGPLPGKEAYNVTIVDTIPYELEWVDWIDDTALKNDAGEKIKATYTPVANPKATGYTGIVRWTIPVMLVGESDKLVYRAKARDLGCPTAPDTYYENVAWIWSDTDSPDSSNVKLMTTCAELPPVIDPQTSLFKTADKKMAEVGDVIRYELEFVNTMGTRVDANCRATTGWQTLGSGSLPAVAPTGLRLNTSGSGAYFFAPEKSYGKDGAVYATIGGSPSSTQALFLVMRYVSGTPGQANFRGVCMQLLVNQDGKNNFGYRLYNDGTMIASGGLTWADAMQFPGSSDAPTFKFVLDGTRLYMYINDFEDEWTNVSKDWPGLTSAGPGHFGMYVNSNGNSNTVLSSFITELDYAFDVTLYDNLPAELGNVTNISNGGTWNTTKNQITWPTIATTTATALAPNASVTRTFEAKVLSCNKFINNYGLATVYGLDTLKVLNTIECGSDKCILTNASLAISHAEICSGDSALLTASATPAGDYMYKYYLNNRQYFADETSNKFFVKETGDYRVVIYEKENATCFAEANAVTLTVDEQPTLNLGSDTTVCNITPILLTAPVADSYKWSDNSTEQTLSVTESGKYSVTITKGACQASDAITVTFGAITLDLGNDISACVGTKVPLKVEGDFDTYKWSTGETGASILVDKTGDYHLTVTKGNCSVSDTITVTFGEITVDLGSDISVCTSDPITLDAKVTADEYKWSDGSTNKTLIVTESGTYHVTIKVGECTASDTIFVSLGSISLDLGEDKTACTGEKVTLDAGAGFDTYEWSTGEKSQTLTVERDGDYSVTVTKGDCSVSDTINVSFGSIKVEVNNEPSCGSVLLTATASIAGAVFEWTLNGETKTGSTLTLDNRTVSSDKGIATVTATATCTSEPLKIAYEIPMLSVEIKGSPSVCPGGTTSLEAIPTSNETDPTFTFQWYNESAPISGATNAILPSATPGNYRVTVKSQYCEEEATHTILEGSGEINGTLTINGEEIIGNPRIYGSCSEELTIKADYLSDNGTFKWSANPANATLTTTGNTITVQPTVDTAYYLQFENQCTTYDTIRIKMKPQATLSVTETKECGKTTLTATPRETLFNAVYTWIVDGVEQSETGSKIEIVKTAEVKTSVRSNEYCQSEVAITNATIDALTVEIAKVNPVCRGQEIKLTASIQTSAIETPQYQWSHRPVGMNLPFAEISGATSDSYTNPALTENTEYRVTVTAGKCTVRQEQIVEILTANLSGTITADGNTVNSVNEKKIHKTCGMTPITLAATHTNTNEASFTWTATPADNTMSTNGKQLTVRPAANTTYIVQYENNCTLTDTIIVEVHPLAASADWSEFAEPKCEGNKLTASLDITGYDENMPGSYIKWYKGGEELIQSAGKTTLVIENSTRNDIGLYSYKVTNGICFSSQYLLGDDVALLGVKSIAQFDLPQTAYTIVRGEGVTLQATNIQPNDATITWTNSTTTHTTNPAVITNITQNQTWTVTAFGANYCETTAEVKIQVDAKPEISIAIKDDNSKICQGTAITLTADTTGTGKLLNPTDYKITWLEEKNGTFTQIGQNSATLTTVPTVSTRYKAEVTYGSQQVSSTEVMVEVYAPASYTLTQSPKTCSGDEITVGIENLQPANATVKWDDDNTITSSDLTTLQLTVKPEEGASKEYHFTIDQAGRCSERGKLTVGIQHPIVYKLSNDTIVCQGEKVELTARAPQGTAYQWTNENSGEKVGTSSKLEAAPKENTTYSVTMTSQGVCPPITETIMVEVAGSPEITEIKVLRVRDVEILTNPNAGRYPFLYKIDNEAYRETNILTARYYGKYTYTVQDANGCKTSRDYTITAPAIIPPLFFTPGSGDENDEWKVPELADAYPDAVITIFDRFGKKLVEIKASDGGWDGTYLGKPMPTTDYWYEIVVAEIDKIYIGHFTLLRK